MARLIELVALKDLSHSIGSVSVGQLFRVSPDYAKSLVDQGYARFKDHVFAATEQRKRKWEGAKVVIIAGGPSLTTPDLELIHLWRQEITPEKRRVVVINTSFQSAPWADVLYAADLSWWKYYYEMVEADFRGERWSSNEDAKKLFGVNHIRCVREQGHCTTPGIIHNGGNSGYQAIELVADWGAASVILVAYDMQRTGKMSHHYGDHPKPLRQNSPYKTWLRDFKALANGLKKANIRVVNASRETALVDFDQVALEQALGYVDDRPGDDKG